MADTAEISYCPIEKINNKVRIAKADSILSQFEKRSEEILDDDFVTKSYAEMEEKRLSSYLVRLGGRKTNNILFRGLNKLFLLKLVYKAYFKEDLLCLVNYLRCEAHNELIDMGCMGRIKNI